MNYVRKRTSKPVHTVNRQFSFYEKFVAVVSIISRKKEKPSFKTSVKKLEATVTSVCNVID